MPDDGVPWMTWFSQNLWRKARKLSKWLLNAYALKHFHLDVLRVSWSNLTCTYLGVAENRGCSPQIIHFNRGFHYKPSILRYPYFWKHQFWKEWVVGWTTNQLSWKTKQIDPRQSNNIRDWAWFILSLFDCQGFPRFYTILSLIFYAREIFYCHAFVLFWTGFIQLYTSIS